MAVMIMSALRASFVSLAIFGELDTPEAVKANVRAIRQILDQAGRRDYTVKVYPNGPDGGSFRQSQRVGPPQTIPTGFLRNDGRLDDNTGSSACTTKALGHYFVAAGGTA